MKSYLLSSFSTDSLVGLAWNQSSRALLPLLWYHLLSLLNSEWQRRCSTTLLFEGCLSSWLWFHYSRHTGHHTSSIWVGSMPRFPEILFSLGLHEPQSTFPTNYWQNPRSSKLTKTQTILLQCTLNPPLSPPLKRVSLANSPFLWMKITYQGH